MGEANLTAQDPRTAALAWRAAKVLDDGKAAEITLLDVAGVSAFADYFVIATGQSETHMKALAGQVREALAAEGLRIGHAEGRSSKTWILLDFDSVIVHIFSRRARGYYALEDLWGDAKPIPWSGMDPPGEVEKPPWR